MPTGFNFDINNINMPQDYTGTDQEVVAYVQALRDSLGIDVTYTLDHVVEAPVNFYVLNYP